MNIVVNKPNYTLEQKAFIAQLAKDYELLLPIAELVCKASDFEIEKVRHFLSEENKPWSYKGIPDIEEAARILAKHIQSKSKIRIIGDFDVDGISSVTLLLIILEELNADVSYDIPNRRLDGYGINNRIVEQCITDGIELIITVDNGVSANDALACANDAGIEVIVTDHHMPPEVLPTAAAIVNPVLKTSTYTNKDLAGVGVVYKLVQALMKELKLKPSENMIQQMYALVALGTICDVMNITGENRDLVKKGLNALNNYNVFPQLKAFAKQASVGSIGFQIGPRLNACGRLDTADIAIGYLLGKNLNQVEYINELNKRRQDMQKEAFERIITRIDDSKNIIIDVAEDVDEGVTGLIANDIKEEFYRPSIIFTKTVNGTYKSSGRSIEEFDLFTHVQKHLDLLDGGGGHSMACGLRASSLEQIQAFKEAMENEVKDLVFPSARNIHNTIKVDSVIDVQKIPLKVLQNQVEKLAPFGKGNPTPTFLIKDVSISLTTRQPKGYIVTDIVLEDYTKSQYKLTLWNDDTMPDIYNGKANIVITPRNDYFTVKCIELLDEVDIQYKVQNW